MENPKILDAQNKAIRLQSRFREMGIGLDVESALEGIAAIEEFDSWEKYKLYFNRHDSTSSIDEQLSFKKVESLTRAKIHTANNQHHLRYCKDENTIIALGIAGGKTSILNRFSEVEFKKQRLSIWIDCSGNLKQLKFASDNIVNKFSVIDLEKEPRLNVGNFKNYLESSIGRSLFIRLGDQPKSKEILGAVLMQIYNFVCSNHHAYSSILIDELDRCLNFHAIEVFKVLKIGTSLKIIATTNYLCDQFRATIPDVFNTLISDSMWLEYYDEKIKFLKLEQRFIGGAEILVKPNNDSFNLRNAANEVICGIMKRRSPLPKTSSNRDLSI